MNTCNCTYILFAQSNAKRSLLRFKITKLISFCYSLCPFVEVLRVNILYSVLLPWDASLFCQSSNKTNGIYTKSKLSAKTKSCGVNTLRMEWNTYFGSNYKCLRKRFKHYKLYLNRSQPNY